MSYRDRPLFVFMPSLTTLIDNRSQKGLKLNYNLSAQLYTKMKPMLPFNSSIQMQSKARLYHLILIVSFFIFSCSKDSVASVETIAEGTEISYFSFLRTHNPSLPSDQISTIEDNLITSRLPYEAELDNLVATFKHNGSKVVVNNFEQNSGSTYNDFTNVVTYTIKTSDGRKANYDVDITYFTGLPIIYINTDGNVAIDSKEDYRDGLVSITGGRNVDDMVESTMKIKGRGNSTWFTHPKKPYQLKFAEKTAMLGMPEDKKWIFLAEYSDKTLLRNKIAFEMGYLSNLDWTPQSVFAEVFVNNEYIGTYNISQKVEESDNRVVLGDNGYLLEIDQLDRLDPDDVYFRTNNFLINIKEPDISYNSNAFNFAEELLNEFENVLNGPQFRDPLVGYAKYIDIDSFVDWYLISEITKNQDSKSFSSIFLNVIPGEKIKMGPLWDFDLAFGNVNYSECTNPDGFWVKHHNWYRRLFEDASFVSKVKSRFLYFRENQQAILDKIDNYANYLQWSQLENNDKWNLFGRYVWPNPVFYDSHEEEVTHLKNWYTDRMNWLNTAFNNL